MENNRLNSLYNRFGKRILGFFLACILLLLLWPLYLIIAVFVLLEDGTPILYTPLRGGYKNKSFKIYKFRTMVKNADQIGGGTTALHDPRITKTGNFLRKTKLDEIPQLFNILKGEMAFIGPRPELLKYTNNYQGEEKFILEVRPGISDFSSIEFINLDEIVGAENADEAYEMHVLKKKNMLRIQYANQVSFLTDVKLLFKTVGKVLNKIVKILFGGKR